MSVNWEAKIIEDAMEYEKIAQGYDYRILERTAECEKNSRNKLIANAWLACAGIIGFAFLIWIPVHYLPWKQLWQDVIWFWNSGGESPWDGPARWGVLTGLACMVWFCFVGAYEWWTKDRR